MKECNKIKDLFGVYIYHAATPDERTAVEKHIQNCEECAADLQSRQGILEKLMPDSQVEDLPQRMQENFACNVYKRIASESLKRQSRQVFLRRFVLQPSLAVAIAALVITVGFMQFYDGADRGSQVAPVALGTDEASKKELREAVYVEQFMKRQGTPYEEKTNYAEADTVSTDESLSPSMSRIIRDTQASDSRRRLENANFINYSLGDRGRALAEYQKLIDDWPNTDAAAEAQRIVGKLSGNGTGAAAEKRMVNEGI